MIAFVCPEQEFEDRRDNETECKVIRLGRGEFLIPGMIDTHLHAPQYVNAGKGLDLQLLDWLQTYTFPTEAKFTDLKYAERVYNRLVRRILHNGTTTACYFASNDTDSSLKLCEIIENYGQRALVGKVCSNQHCPEYYMDSTEDCLKDTHRFMEAVNEKKNELLKPIITPRFAGSCDRQLMEALGGLKEKYNAHLQTHISENKSECEFISRLYPDCENYAEVYHKTNLLGHKTVLAHAIHLSDAEINTLSETGTGVSHCPNSNISLRSGLCDVRRLLERGVKVGLGTDVSGGYQSSLLDAIRLTVQTSNIISMERPGYKTLDYKEAFRLATLGGAKVLDMEDVVGNFDVGKAFDAVRVNVFIKDSPVDVFETDTLADVVQKFIYLGDDRNVSEVYVNGRQVWPSRVGLNGYIARMT